MEEKKTILTGIRPTGNLHLGHYFGAVGNWVKSQEAYNEFIEVADVQALTDNFNNPDKVRKNVRELTLDLLACGIDPTKAKIFIQSMIPEIAELTVYYSNLVTVSRLERNPTIKTEISQKKALFGNDGESVTYGFLGYPVSQTADITALGGTLVPVGDDQLPLLEQAREIVRKFNSIYGETLQEPEHLLSSIPRLKGLDGNEKMGKSLGNAIFLVDDDETVTKKVMDAKTDPDKIKKDDPANPDVCMVHYYHKLVTKDLDTITSECKAGARGCVACKKELAANLINFLKPIKEKRRYYEQNPKEVDKILLDGTKAAKEKAEQTMSKVKKAIKIDYFE